jgi:MFS family permease
LLGLPTLALALGVTVVGTYLPVLAKEFVASTFVVGLVIGVEGLLALWLPLVVGAWSDRLRTPLGGRLPFVIAGTPLVAVGLAVMAIVHSLATLIVASLVFFLGYFLAYEPYRALYPDLVSEEAAGRAQGNQAVWRGAGTALALLGGGLLLALGNGAPFIAAAVISTAVLGAFLFGMIRRGVPDSEPGETGVRHATKGVVDLVRHSRPLRAFLVANALWELSLGALKTFIVLYVTVRLGYSRAVAALLIGGVACLILVAAVTSGRLADRRGSIAVMRVALPVYGLAMIPPALFSAHWVVAVCAPLVAIGGGAIMALPYAVLMPLMPDHEHGSLTGYYSFSRGLGTWLGPLLAGLAISVIGGYQAMWLVCAAAILLSIPLLPALRA